MHSHIAQYQNGREVLNRIEIMLAVRGLSGNSIRRYIVAHEEGNDEEVTLFYEHGIVHEDKPLDLYWTIEDCTQNMEATFELTFGDNPGFVCARSIEVACDLSKFIWTCSYISQLNTPAGAVDDIPSPKGDELAKSYGLELGQTKIITLPQAWAMIADLMEYYLSCWHCLH